MSKQPDPEIQQDLVDKGKTRVRLPDTSIPDLRSLRPSGGSEYLD